MTNEIVEGFIKAIELVITFNPEVWQIAGRTLGISLSSTLLVSLICIPLGGIISFYDFIGKRFLINIVQTLFSLPTVCVGLFVFLLLSKAGPFGMFNLLFTPVGMIIGQMILIMPIMLGLTISALSSVSEKIKDTAISLGASDFQTIFITMKEARYAIISAIALSFGRAISEVGVAMMVGGNIRGFTRVLTTAIALETSMGRIEIAIALGIILLVLALIINLILNQLQQMKAYDNS